MLVANDRIAARADAEITCFHCTSVMNVVVDAIATNVCKNVFTARISATFQNLVVLIIIALNQKYIFIGICV